MSAIVWCRCLPQKALISPFLWLIWMCIYLKTRHRKSFWNLQNSCMSAIQSKVFVFSSLISAHATFWYHLLLFQASFDCLWHIYKLPRKSLVTFRFVLCISTTVLAQDGKWHWEKFFTCAPMPETPHESGCHYTAQLEELWFLLWCHFSFREYRGVVHLFTLGLLGS